MKQDKRVVEKQNKRNDTQGMNKAYKPENKKLR